MASFFKNKDKASLKVVNVQFKHDQQSNLDQQSSFHNTDLQTSIPLTYRNGSIINVEINWFLKNVISGYRDNSLTDSWQLFEAMVPNSKFASIMELGRSKLKYIVSFVLWLYFQDILKSKIASEVFDSI